MPFRLDKQVLYAAFLDISVQYFVGNRYWFERFSCFWLNLLLVAGFFLFNVLSKKVLIWSQAFGLPFCCLPFPFWPWLTTLFPFLSMMFFRLWKRSVAWFALFTCTEAETWNACMPPPLKHIQLYDFTHACTCKGMWRCTRILFLKQGHSKSIPRTWNVVRFFSRRRSMSTFFFAEAFQVPSPKALKNSRLAFHVYAFHVAWKEILENCHAFQVSVRKYTKQNLFGRGFFRNCFGDFSSEFFGREFIFQDSLVRCISRKCLVDNV